MAFWDNLWPGSKASQFDSGNAASNSIELTKRRPTVSLSKQGAATGNLRVNLSWQMRTSDIEGRSRQGGRILGNPLKIFKPEVVQGHTQALVNVDLDLGCLYEMADGSKGVVQ
ncbi:Tellurium resistance, partial [Streptomyces sp. NPDC087850]